ncbi:MAG: alpha/beta fold hydrolase, partial [Acidobacteria bacterium]|nr:alpha/beta fold hydrolase [Acidobacteriota bacterium]
MTPAARLGRIENLLLSSPAGRLEVLWKHQPEATDRIVVLCHPHPLHGGTMHSKVVFHAAKAFFQGKFDVVRFNFRGVGQSTGSFDHGVGEQEDLRVVLRAVKRRRPGTLPVVCGYSFGAYVSGRVAASAPAAALVMVAPPARSYPFGFLKQVTVPAVVVFGTRDEFAGESERRQIAGYLRVPHEVVTLDA